MSEEVFAEHGRRRLAVTARRITARVLVGVAIYVVAYACHDLLTEGALTPQRLLHLGVKGTLFVIDLAWMLVALELAVLAALQSAAWRWYLAEGWWRHVLQFWNILNLLSRDASNGVAEDRQAQPKSPLSGGSRQALRTVCHFLCSSIVCIVAFLLLTSPITAISWKVSGVGFASWDALFLEAVFRNVTVLLAVCCLFLPSVLWRLKAAAARD